MMHEQRQSPTSSIPVEGVIEERAHAKINLHLRIVGRRADGYHELETIFQEVTLADRLTFRLHRDKISLSVGDADLPVDDTNLVMQAANRLRAVSGVELGAIITLDKHIPIAAGLGGGSSDAAAALRGLCRLWGVSFAGETTHGIARDLGADVPFFLAGGTALGTGIGDCLKTLEPLPPYPLLLVKPSFAVSTAWVYKNVSCDLTKQEYTNNSNALISSLTAQKVDTWESFFYNDLEKVVLGRFPEVKRLKRRLVEAGAAFASMSGSGPTVFGIFEDESVRDAAGKNLADDRTACIRCAFRLGS